MLKYSKDGKVFFDPKWNSFVFEKTKRLRSWSKIIKQYTNEVDSQFLAENYAVKNGYTPEYWIEKWKEKAEKSRSVGIGIHNFIDNFIQTGVLNETGFGPKEKSALSFIEDMFFTNRLVPIESEFIVYNDQLKAATMVDCIARNADGKYFIIDWKTNGEIKTKSYGKYLKGSMCHLKDTQLIQYSLEVNFQKQLCKDYEISGMYLAHIKENGYKLIPVSDMKLDLDKFCEIF